MKDEKPQMLDLQNDLAVEASPKDVGNAGSRVRRE